MCVSQGSQKKKGPGKKCHVNVETTGCLKKKKRFLQSVGTFDVILAFSSW